MDDCPLRADSGHRRYRSAAVTRAPSGPQISDSPMTSNLRCFVTTFTKMHGRATQDGILVLFATMNLLRNSNRVEAAPFRCISVIRGFGGGYWDKRKVKGWSGMGAKRIERRKTPRSPSSLPVVLENSTGVLRDISLSGAFFWTHGTYRPDDPIGFAIQLETAGKTLMWKCEGHVVRTEQHGPDVGLGVRITRTEVEKPHPVLR